MILQKTRNRSIDFFRSGKAAQTAWILFALLALSLALPGISHSQALLQTACQPGSCFTGQLSANEIQKVINSSNSLAEYSELALIIFLFTCAFLFLVGAAFIWRKPTHLSAVLGAFMLIAASTSELARVTALLVPALVIPAQFIRFLPMALLFPFFVLVPGDAVRPGWLKALSLVIALAAATVILNLPGSTTYNQVSVIFSISVLFLTTGWTIIRYSRSTGSPQQEKTAWVLAAVLLLVSTQWIGRPVQLLPLPPASMDGVPNSLFDFFSVIGLLLMVAAVTCLSVTLLGDELFRVDVAINRAVVYSLLTLFVIGIYVLIVGYLSLLFQSSRSLWFSLVATGVVAVLFQPIRQAVQRFVNRMIYGDRDDPYTAITRLGQQLESIPASDEIFRVILHTVRDALKVSYAAIALYRSDQNDPVVTAEEGLPSRVILSLPLAYQQELLGELRLGVRSGESGFSTSDRRLLDGLVRQAGAAIHAAQQNADLQQVRERLVIAQEEERRRIRRDLHDGLGSSLAALSLQAGEAQRLLATDPAAAAQRINELRAGLRRAIGDIRRLVYGLRPPVLDELGLLEALRGRIAQYQTGNDAKQISDREDIRPPIINFIAPPHLPPLPAAVEVAIYRIVEEGLANIAHHSRAKAGWIDLQLEETGIRIEIRDDGIGIQDVVTPGIGLVSMRERAVELGGSCSLQSNHNQGTQICIWLPIQAEIL